jgi:hypothetical protein
MSRRDDRERRRVRKVRYRTLPDPGPPDMARAREHWMDRLAGMTGRGFASSGPPFAGLAFPNAVAEPCPTCGSTDKVIPIVYGRPTSETWQLAKAGRVALGGCVVTGEDPAWRCRSCRADFGRSSRRS